MQQQTTNDHLARKSEPEAHALQASAARHRAERNARRRELYFEQKTLKNEIGVQSTRVMQAIEARPPGVYEVGELMKGHWKRIPKRGRNRYGYIFNGLVVCGCFPRLRWLGRRSNGHHLYELLADDQPRPARGQRHRGVASTADDTAGEQ